MKTETTETKKVIATLFFKVGIPVALEVPVDANEEDIANSAFEDLESKATVVVPAALGGYKTLANIDLDQMVDFTVETR